MRQIRNFPEFTHFACLPFRDLQQRELILKLQKTIKDIVDVHYPKDAFIESNPQWAHVTLSMLILHRQDMRIKFREIFNEIKQQLAKILSLTSLTFSKINYFSKLNQKTKKKEVTLIYLQIQQNEQWQKLLKSADIFIRNMIKTEIIVNNQLKQMRITYDHNSNLYKNEQYHLTLFRVKNIEDNEKFQQRFKEIQSTFKSVVFQCRSLDISTRNHYEETGFYSPIERLELEFKK